MIARIAVAVRDLVKRHAHKRDHTRISTPVGDAAADARRVRSLRRAAQHTSQCQRDRAKIGLIGAGSERQRSNRFVICVTIATHPLLLLATLLHRSTPRTHRPPRRSHYSRLLIQWSTRGFFFRPLYKEEHCIEQPIYLGLGITLACTTTIQRFSSV